MQRRPDKGEARPEISRTSVFSTRNGESVIRRSDSPPLAGSDLISVLDALATRRRGARAGASLPVAGRKTAATSARNWPVCILYSPIIYEGRDAADAPRMGGQEVASYGQKERTRELRLSRVNRSSLSALSASSHFAKSMVRARRRLAPQPQLRRSRCLCRQ